MNRSKSNLPIGCRPGSLARIIARVFIVAVGLNYPWEIAQARLYLGMEDFGKVWWHCAQASLEDGLLVLLIFAAGWITTRNRDWFKRPGVGGRAVMLVVGLAISIGVERIAVYRMGRWSYTEAMPILPFVRVGLTPVLEMIVLPPIIFYVVGRWCGEAGYVSQL